MKAYRSLIFLVIMALLLGGAYWFSHFKNKTRTTSKVEIKFTKPPLLLDTLLVNKLLTQNLPLKYSLQKDSLDLNILENQMNKIPEFKNVEIFLFPEGELIFQITERKPLFKLNSNPSLYSDVNGILFKFNSSDSSKFPLFKTISSTLSFETSAYVIKNLKKDPFLSGELHKVELIKDEYQLKLKSFDFNIIFGSPKRIKEKIKKLKVFCAFQKVQDSLTNYKKINLSYINQVVATMY